jgi:uracil-DNA glycosylase family 4
VSQTKLIEDDEISEYGPSTEYKCCPLWKTRNKMVWIRGASTKDVDILFVGEAPGRDENLLGRPFVGKAGQILNKWIEEAGVTNYAIINIVKCRPPNNRKPLQSEIRSCLPYFVKQVKELNPRLIVALGATASSVLTNRKEVVSNIGKIFKTRYGDVIVFPHPAYVLRGVDVYIPITELKEVLRYNVKEVKHEEKGYI